jgi:hypothetical protein
VLNRRSQIEDKPIARSCLPTGRRGGGWLERRSLAFKVGLLLGSVHLLFVLASVIDIIHHQEGRWHMFWILCGYIDFPVTLLLSKVILPVFSPFFIRGDPYLAAGHSLQIFLIFSLFHTLVGSGWYFALPILISKAAVKIASTAKAAVAAAAMMIIPIPAHWLQLIRFFGRDTAPTAIGLNALLPGVWTILFVWLLVTNVRRKALLWLVCLVPFVFYYLAQDLYYCFVLARN